MNITFLRSLIRKNPLIGVLVTGLFLLAHTLLGRKNRATMLFPLVVVSLCGYNQTLTYRENQGKAAEKCEYAIVDLGVLPGTTQSIAWTINDNGLVVGDVTDFDNKRIVAFLWQGGVMNTLSGLDAERSTARGINERNQIVGFARFADGSGHAYLWENNTVRDLGTLPDGGVSGAVGINNSGQVTGTVLANGERGSRAFLWENGQMLNLGTLPNGKYSMAEGINDQGQVVGVSHSGENWGDYPIPHAFVWDSCRGMQDLGTLPETGYPYRSSHAFAINNNGQIVGESNGQGFFFIEGKMTALAMPEGYTRCAARGINNQGEIVGMAEKPGQAHACLWSKSRAIDLNETIPSASGWELVYANDINDSGQIIGSGQFQNQYHAFLLTPVRR